MPPTTEQQRKSYMPDEVERTLAGHGTYFTAMLFRLMAKADDDNFLKLFWAFPTQGHAFLDWRFGHPVHAFNGYEGQPCMDCSKLAIHPIHSHKYLYRPVW